MKNLRSMMMVLAAALAFAAPRAAMAQEAPPAAAPTAAEKVDIITPHITDSHEIDYPCFNRDRGFVCEGRLTNWAPVHVGGLTLDLNITKHVFFLLLASFCAMVILIWAARSHARAHEAIGRPKGFAAGLEAMVLYMRNEVIIPNVGHHGDAYVPFCLSLFFFILFANLFGLIPYGSTATGNISVTATLAIITFIVIEIAGMRAQGMGYLKTIFYWPSDAPPVQNAFMTIIMTPVEIIGKFTKPFALAIRLFANMTAGHVVLLALISLVFTFQNWAIGFVAPVPMAVAISCLELFVAFLQAFIFTLLASVFIGQIRASHH